MNFKKINRVMAALVCGAIVASSGSVAAFASNQNAPAEEQAYQEFRAVKVAPAKHGKIYITGKAYGMGYAACDSIVKVNVTPDAGYKIVDVRVEGSYNEIKGENGNYTFQMPWCDPTIGVKVVAEFAPIK